jgi:hypothetical protein
MLFPDERDDLDAVRGMLIWSIVGAMLWLLILL